MMDTRKIKWLSMFGILAVISPALCQTGGPYVLDWSTIDGGGRG